MEIIRIARSSRRIRLSANPCHRERLCLVMCSDAASAFLQPPSLRCSLSRSFVSTAPYFPTERDVLAPMTAICERLSSNFRLPLLQVWAPCVVTDDSVAHGSSPASFAALQCRGMPASVGCPEAWAYRIACCERALPPCAALPGGAWHCRSLLWAGCAAALGRSRDPTRPFVRLAGLERAGSFACTISPGAADGQAAYILHGILPAAASSAPLQLRTLRGLVAAASILCAASGLVLNVSEDDILRVEAYEAAGRGAAVLGTHGRMLPIDWWAPEGSYSLSPPLAVPMPRTATRAAPPRGTNPVRNRGVCRPSVPPYAPPRGVVRSRVSGRVSRAPRSLYESSGDESGDDGGA